MNKSMNKVIKSHVFLAVLSVVAVVLMTGGLTYALFQMESHNTENQTIAIGNFSANMTSGTGSITLRDLYPQSASEITDSYLKYTFTVTNDGDYDIDYQIYLTDGTAAFLSDSANTEYTSYKQLVAEHYKYINYKLDGKDAFANISSMETDAKTTVLTGSLKPGESEDHYLQFFLDSSAPNEINGSIVSLDIHMLAAIQGTDLTPAEKTLDILNIKKQESQEGVPNFALAATTDETADGLYSMIDDSGKPSYYYRGAVTNNYVKFGKNKTGQDMYWRIIRFNGDGTVRMQYDGAGTANDPNYTYTRGFALTSQVWNTKYDDAKYVGWMFGGAQGSASTSKTQAQANETPSEIKTAVDTWYKENIYDTGWHDYIADEIFCNDRSTPGKDATGLSTDTGLGYAKNVTAYGATSRTNVWNTDASKLKPSFVCPQESDKFTVSTDSGGNGKLTYPVGLITADEIVAAGSGKYGTTNQSYYLHKGSWYWSFSPFHFSGSRAYVFGVNGNGYLNGSYVNSSGAVAPVINLKAEYVSQLRGKGKSTDPFRLG